MATTVWHHGGGHARTPDVWEFDSFGIDEQTGQLSPTVTRKVDTLHWGFALEFSTLYLTSRFTRGNRTQCDGADHRQ